MQIPTEVCEAYSSQCPSKDSLALILWERDGTILSFTLHWITSIFGLAGDRRKNIKLNRAPTKSPNSTPNITLTRNVTIAATASLSAIKYRELFNVKYERLILKSNMNKCRLIFDKCLSIRYFYTYYWTDIKGIQNLTRLYLLNIYIYIYISQVNANFLKSIFFCHSVSFS